MKRYRDGPLASHGPCDRRKCFTRTTWPEYKAGWVNVHDMVYATDEIILKCLSKSPTDVNILATML